MDTPGSQQEAGQVTADAAVVYETPFVPAIFGQWSVRVADALRLAPGDDVLDVACCTGGFAREALHRVQPGGTVTGLDPNAGMLQVAAQKAPGITWQQSQAEALPFPDGTFDAVACQFGLMFFDDRVVALREMWRVLRRGGRLVVTVWAPLDQSPGWAAMERLETRFLGVEAAAAPAIPFCLGNTKVLELLWEQAGIPSMDLTTVNGTVRFPSAATLIEAELKGWTVSEQVTEDTVRRFQAEAVQVLAPFQEPDGTVAFSMPAHVLTAAKA